MNFTKTPIFSIIPVIIALSITTVQSQEPASASKRKPLIILEERTRPAGEKNSIWKLHSLNPTFVLYDDGLVVFKKNPKSSDFYSVNLDEAALNALLKKFEINEFLKLEDSYSINNKFHQPVNFIQYWQGSKMKKVRVIGTLRDDTEDRSKSPGAFLTIFDQMASFKDKNSSLWTPYQLEIGLYPQNNPQGEPIQWPSEWPVLNHKTTKKRSDSDLSHAYKIYLDGRHEKELVKLLSGAGENHAVIINGQPWRLAPQRYIFPNENIWITEKSKSKWDTISDPE